MWLLSSFLKLLRFAIRQVAYVSLVLATSNKDLKPITSQVVAYGFQIQLKTESISCIYIYRVVIHSKHLPRTLFQQTNLLPSNSKIGRASCRERV